MADLFELRAHSMSSVFQPTKSKALAALLEPSGDTVVESNCSPTR